MASGASKVGSLRERKKARTRQELVAIGDQLFRKQGYEETTLEQIADGAEVSIRTLLRYFESKQQLALAGYHEALDSFCAMLADPQREMGTLACWRHHVLSAAEALNSPTYAAHLRFLHTVPVLVMGLLEVNRRYEDALAEALAADAGIKPECDLYGRLLAAMLVAGNSAAMRRWIKSGKRKQNLSELCLAVTDFAIENFPPRSTRGAKRLCAM